MNQASAQAHDTSADGATPARPLAGTRVLEFGHVAAGPYAAMLMGDLGADVVKVEPPRGDDMRQWPPTATNANGQQFSHNFASVNRNKRSIIADLKDPSEYDFVRSLVDAADVVIENYRPGTLDRLGLDYRTLSRNHRGLIYCSVSGFGQHSPYRDRGAFDVVIQAMSGLMSVTGDPAGDAAKCGVPVGDFVAGLYAALTVAATLPLVRATGQSVQLDCPMLDCLLAVSALQTSEYWGTSEAPERLGSAHPRNAPYQTFHAADGVFALAAGNDRLWHAVCDAMDRTDLLADSRFQTQAGRAQHQNALAKELQHDFERKPRDYWIETFDNCGVPCGPLYGFDEILSDRHVEATGLVTTMDVPVIGATPTVVYPVRTHGHERVTDAPPDLGEDQTSVRRDWLADT